MNFEPKTSAFDGSLTNSWVSLDDTSHLSHASSGRSNDIFPSQGYHVESQVRAFAGLEGTVMATTQPWYNDTTYTSLDNH
jgi:hypothetical protein